MDTQQHHLDGSSSQMLRAFSRELNASTSTESRNPTLCECGHCGEQIEVEADAYERARAVPGRLLVKHGREYTEHPTDADSLVAGEAP